MSKLSDKFAAGKRDVKEREAAAAEAGKGASIAQVEPSRPHQHMATHGSIDAMKFNTMEAKIEKLEVKLQEFDGTLPTKPLDPKLIVRSKWANRHALSFKDQAFEDLKAEIKAKGYNVQPIKVRPLKGHPGMYEIIFGHRRHQACLELGIDVMAMIEDLDEMNLFLEMDHENRQRKDLRPYEQGVMYAKALDDGLFSSMRKLAEKVGVEQGNMSKYVALARLPEPIIAAFGSPLDLQQRWATVLSDAFKANPDVVLERARVMFGTSPRPSAAAVFKMLVEGEGDVRNITHQKDRQITSGKSLLATVKEGKKGATTVDIAVSLNADDKKQLEALLSEFLKKRLVKD
jgi:ParB family chromosome partitioning protein